MISNTVANKVAVIQMVSQADVGYNLATAYELLTRAAAQGACLAVLPENFAAMGGDLRRLAMQESDGTGMILPWLAEAACALKLWIVAGTVPLLPEAGTLQKPQASSLLFNPEGTCVARYDKLHLFDAAVADAYGAYRESDYYQPGNKVVVVDTPVGRLGFAVCYDLRFPELFTALRAAGAELICVPSAFTEVTGAAHWQILLRARAIETQCYLLAANQGGVHSPQRTTFGHSTIIDGWGHVVAEQPTGAGVLVADCDLLELAKIRSAMPIQIHRRFPQVDVAHLSKPAASQ